MISIRAKRLTPTATLPQRSTSGAVGFDVRADFFDAGGRLRVLTDGRDPVSPRCVNQAAGRDAAQTDWGVMLRPGRRLLVPTGIAMASDGDVYVRVAPRSGLALRSGIDVLGGVVDSGDYRGEVGVILLNTDPEEPVAVHHGMKIAQLVFTLCHRENVVEVQELDGSERGAQGFGSTGLT